MNKKKVLFTISLMIGLTGSWGLAAAPHDNPYYSDGKVVIPESRTGRSQLMTFVDYNTSMLSLRRVKVFVDYDQDGLNFSFEMPKRVFYDMGGERGRDAGLWYDNCVEVLIQPKQGGRFYHFMVNPLGTVADGTYDGDNIDLSWNASAFKPEVVIEKNSWKVKFKILFSDIQYDMAKDGPDLWGNIGIKSVDPKNKYQLVWSYCGRSLSDMNFFGRWSLQKQLPFVEAMMLDEKTDGPKAEFIANYVIANPSDKLISWTADGNRTISIPAHSSTRVTDVYPLTQRENSIKMEQGPALSYRAWVKHPTMPEIRPYAVSRDEMKFQMLNTDSWKDRIAKIKITLDGKEVADCNYEETFRKIVKFGGLKTGWHDVAADLFTAEGNLLASAKKKVFLIDLPSTEFDLSKLDLSRYYPPIVQEGKTFRAARSVFNLSAGPLPDQITVNGQPVLREPVKMVFDGKPLTFTGGFNVVAKNKNFVTLSADGTLDGLPVKVMATLYYDGLIWYNVSLTGKNIEYGPLQVTIPMTLAGEVLLNHALLLHDDNFGKKRVSYIAAPTDLKMPGYNKECETHAEAVKGPVDLPLSAYVALASDQDEQYCGLGIAIEGPKGWNLKNYDHVYQIVPGKTPGAMDMIMNISDGKTRWKKDRIEFSFGIQPFPIRTFPSDHNLTTRINHCELMGIYWKNDEADSQGKPITVAQKFVNMGMRTAELHQAWTEYQNYWKTVTQDQWIAKSSKALHDAGAKLVVYFGFQISNVISEFEFYRDLVLSIPTVYPDGGYRRSGWEVELSDPRQQAFTVCYNSIWGDYLFNGIREAVEKYDLDGIYMDGTLLPLCCANTLHGCGVVDNYGRTIVTFSLMKLRHYGEYLYKIGLDRKKDFFQNQHVGSPTPPYTGLVTCYLTGETAHLFNNENKLPPDTLRGLLNGRLYGIPSELYLRPPHRAEVFFAESLLVDSYVNWNAGGSKHWMDTTLKVWSIYDKYHLTSDTFTTFFNGKNKVRNTNDKVYVSYYDTRDNLVLIVSDYMSNEPQTTELDISGFPDIDPARGTDVWRDETFNFINGKGVITIPAESMRILVFPKRTSK